MIWPDGQSLFCRLADYVDFIIETELQALFGSGTANLTQRLDSRHLDVNIRVIDKGNQVGDCVFFL